MNKIESLEQYGWPKSKATAFVRAGGRREYCGSDLLHDRLGFAVFQLVLDHLLPQAHFPTLEDVPENWVLSCQICNGAKSDWFPAALLKNAVSTGRLRDDRDNLLKLARRNTTKDAQSTTITGSGSEGSWTATAPCDITGFDMPRGNFCYGIQDRTDKGQEAQRAGRGARYCDAVPRPPANEGGEGNWGRYAGGRASR